MLKHSQFRFGQNVRMSFQNITANKMRSFLTMLGIIIGVAAVISLVTIVSGVQNYIMSSFSSMGAGSITVSVMGTPLKSGLSESDLEAIRTTENVRSISPSVSLNVDVVENGTIFEDATVAGTNDQYFRHGQTMVSGRPLLYSDMDGNVNVCVLDQTAAKQFFPGKNPLGESIIVGGVSYMPVGIVEVDSTYAFGDNDGTVYIPYRNAMRMNNTGTVNSLTVYVDDTDRMTETESRIKAVLDSSFNNADNAYSMMNMESLLSMMDSTMNMLSMMLGGIAGIALLVGGIGIMNMMLTNVSERTKEIGLRKALGAEPMVIQIQFLMESVILSITGGVIGIIAGELIAYVAAVLMDFTYYLDINAILLGFGFSLAVGVIFGWMPARRASQLNPIDALRTE
ncbi:MAG: ABC transporter permease [Bulleidia sp.]|nr:ABC transporter permease [Bulleidia sp.]